MSCKDCVQIRDALTVADVHRAAAIPATPRTTAKAFYAGLLAVDEFLSHCLNPTLETLVGATDQDIALITLHHRIRGYLKSLLVLTHVMHFQSIAAASRSVIELYVDMLLIEHKLIEEAVVKFDAFTAAQRLKAAKRIIAFFAKYPELERREHTHAKTFVGEKADDIERDNIKCWGRKDPPLHWSNHSLTKRAELVGRECEELVFDGYDYRNWLIHSGASGVAGMPVGTFEALSATSLGVVQRTLLKEIHLVATRFKLDETIPGFAERLKDLEKIPGLVDADLRLQTLGEPQRVKLTFQKKAPPKEGV
jgi:hypothetical protein